MKLIGEPRSLHIALGMVNRHIQDQFGTPGYIEWSTIKSFDGAGNPVHCSQGELSYGYSGYSKDRGNQWDWGEREDRERTPRGSAPVPESGRCYQVFSNVFGFCKFIDFIYEAT